jgi:drug/metabolite transporter (DMT)-like permease
MPLRLIFIATSFAMVGICTVIGYAGGSDPLTVITLRTLGTVALLAIYIRVAGLSFRLERRELSLALLLGVPLAVNNYCLNAAMETIPVPLAVLIFYLWPAITACASWAIGKERASARGVAGLVLAFVGVGLAVNVDFTASQARGVGFALAGALVWSLVFMLNNHFFHGRDTRPTTFYMASTAATIFVVACAVTGNVALPVTALGWLGVASLPFFYTFAMIGLFAATMRLGPMRTGFYMNFEPVASVLLAALILGQTLAPIQLAGAALVIAALVMFRPPVRG